MKMKKLLFLPVYLLICSAVFANVPNSSVFLKQKTNSEKTRKLALVLPNQSTCGYSFMCNNGVVRSAEGACGLPYNVIVNVATVSCRSQGGFGGCSCIQ